LRQDDFDRFLKLVRSLFEGGREDLACLNVPIVSLAVVTDMSDGQIVLE